MPIDDVQLAVALMPPGNEWAWRSLARCCSVDDEITVFADLRPEGVRVWPLEPDGSGKLASLASTELRLRPIKASSAQWQARIIVRPPQVGGGFEGTVAAIDWPAAKEASNSRIVYCGISLAGYANRTPWLRESEGQNTSLGYSAIEALKRQTLFAAISESLEAQEDCFMGATLAGPFLSQSELDALDFTLFLLAGTGGTRATVESFDSNGRFVSRHHHRVKHVASQDRQWVIPPEDMTRAETYLEVAQIWERAKDLIERGLPLRALQFHIFASQQRVPELTITHLAIALDGIKTAVVEKIRGEGKLIPSQREFERRIHPIIDAANSVFSSPEEAKLLDHILKRISNSNNWSENKRWERFWRDYIEHELTADEERVLKHRGSAIHSAYILLTEYDLSLNQDQEVDRRPFEARLGQLLTDAQIYRNVINRVLLRLLGYTGNMVDCTNQTARLSLRR